MGVEKKGDSGSGNLGFCEILEVAARKGLEELIKWVRVWWDAGRLTGGASITTNE